MATPDRKKLLFVSMDRNDPKDYSELGEQGVIAALGGNPTVYHLDSAKEGVHDPGVIIRTIREHVKKYGTLKELMIDGHGYTNHMGLTAPIETETFLYDLTKLQDELGIKIADRIEFGGCRVFADLDKAEVGFYKKIAKDLNAEVVGSTTLVFPTPIPVLGPLGPSLSGHFIKFTPEGSVKEDKLNTPITTKYNHLTRSESKADKPTDEIWLASELHPTSTPIAKADKRDFQRNRN